MSVRRPTLEQLRSVAEDLGMHMGDAELKSYNELLQGNFAAYDVVDAMADYLPEVKYPRTPGYRPEGEENKHNAWYVKTTIKGAASGKLAGKTVALKDNICLAGVPMMNGASTLEGYVPDIDATIVTRILDAGGTIIGKTHCEYFCFSGGSHTNATGPVALVWLPPEKQKYSQCVLPIMVPPASRMRVTMVASVVGTYPSSVEAPFIIGTPARLTLSFSAMVLPASLPLDAPLIVVLTYQALCLFSSPSGR